MICSIIDSIYENINENHIFKAKKEFIATQLTLRFSISHHQTKNFFIYQLGKSNNNIFQLHKFIKNQIINIPVDNDDQLSKCISNTFFFLDNKANSCDAENFFILQNFFIYLEQNTIKMKKFTVLIFITILLSLAAAQSPCPIQSQVGSIVSGRLIVAGQKNVIALVPSVDVQCYNYTLPYAFGSAPDVAIGVHDFSTRTTNDIFFSIKPLRSVSYANIPFLVRTQWMYTAWTKISFSFLAEDRRDIESGYYQIDTMELGSCQAGKNIQVSLPFKNQFFPNNPVQHLVFLNGFQISSQNINANSYSPFQVQLGESSANSNGLIVVISVTTITQVHGLHISFVAWSTSSLNIGAGNYVYEFQGGYEIAHTPMTSIGVNYARIHGLSGFIINHNSQSIDFSTTWTGNRFVFDLGASQALTQYFSFNYIFFMGSQCTDCNGYPFQYNDRCVAYCPPGSYPTPQKKCITCGDGFFYDGNSCVKSCPQGQFINPNNGECQCPPGSNWTGTTCLTCSGGRVYSQFTRSCECGPGTRWNGYGCARFSECTNGRQYDVFSFSCQCPTGTTWNGTFCFKPNQCRGGQFLNERYQCVCPNGTYFKDGYCQNTGCTGGQIWNGNSCVCEQGHNWNGSFCLFCINGQLWDQRSRSCVCQTNFIWNGNFCEKSLTCTGGRIYNRQYDICLCPDGSVWNGVGCLTKPQCCCGKVYNEKSFSCDCPEGFKWDGSNCVVCTSGKTWDHLSKTCVCPPGTQWNNQFCTVIENCRGGMIWNQNTWACECPSTTVWNGNFCIGNPCKNGQVWDNFSSSCRCVNNYVFIDNKCVPPQIACTYGRVWNAAIYACQCPRQTFDTGYSCDPIKQCESNLVNNPLNNKCICPSGLVWLSSKNACGDPTCPERKRWDGQGCVDISCPPGSYYNGTECLYDSKADNCQPWEYFNGNQCIYFQDTCPKGTRWDGNSCASTGNCPVGFYSQGVTCKPFPQRCIPPTLWQNNRCVPSGNSCPSGTYRANSGCQPMNQCQNGQIWDSSLIQCVCPQGNGWNGVQCVSCGSGQIWDLYEGCKCPQGSFFKGDKCQQPNQNKCLLIPNAFWDSSANKCLCDPGFSVIGYQCICKGVPFEHFCDRCAHRPNSQWRFGQCQCISGYTLYGSQCLPNQNDGNDRQADCSVGTFFDTQQKKCLACPQGCLSCSDSYTCRNCNPDFTFDFVSQLCIERCGDGRRYSLECDDGNNDPNDGCDISCKIEPGYSCQGGSPTSRDSCIIYTPTSVTLIQTGQIRYSTKIIVNIKLDYLPKALVQSSSCSDSCSQVLMANIIGENALRIKSTYLAGTRYGFTVQIQFGRPYVSAFKVQIYVNPSLGSRYFGSINIGQKLVIDVNPALLSIADSHQGSSNKDSQDILV